MSNSGQTLLSLIPHCDVICSDWPWTCHQSPNCTSSTTTAWYRGLSTIQWDDIDEARSTSTFTLDTSIFNVGNIGTGNVHSFLMRTGSRYSELMAGLIYQSAGERTAPCCVQETNVWRWICDGH